MRKEITPPPERLERQIIGESRYVRPHRHTKLGGTLKKIIGHRSYSEAQTKAGQKPSQSNYPMAERLCSVSANCTLRILTPSQTNDLEIEFQGSSSYSMNKIIFLSLT